MTPTFSGESFPVIVQWYRMFHTKLILEKKKKKKYNKQLFNLFSVGLFKKILGE